MQFNQDKSLMLVDGMALLFRAYYATAVTGQFMYNEKGIPTNGVYGFVKHLLTAVSSFKPSHVAVCWDMGSQTFRNEMYDSYKANRGEPPLELIPQFDLAKEVVKSFDIPNIGRKGYEADDCIGTIAKKAHNDIHVQILTGDKDILQLLDQQISVILMQNGYGNYAVHTKESFYEEKGILPQQMIDVKALMGDSSDNYPGVKGIGEKTALKLIQQYDHVEGILSNLDKLTKGQRTKIEQDLEMLYLSQKLAKIYCEVPIEFSLADSLLKMSREKIGTKFADVGFKGLERFFEKEYIY